MKELATRACTQRRRGQDQATEAAAGESVRRDDEIVDHVAIKRETGVGRERHLPARLRRPSWHRESSEVEVGASSR